MHWHKWEVRGVEHFKYDVEDKEFSVTTNVPKTRVLQRCSKCGKPKTRELDGHWTIEQLEKK